MKRNPYIIALVSLLWCMSCITNDVPLPVKVINVLSVRGDGLTVTDNDINRQDQCVTLHLDETTDMRKVSITEVKITEGGLSDRELTGTFDFTSPQFFKLYLYQDYIWRFQAQQNIERYFNVTEQIGESDFVESARLFCAHVPRGTNMEKVKVRSVKLGPRDITTITPDPYTLNFSSEQTSFDVKVSYFDREETWTLAVEQTDISIQFTAAVAWETSMRFRVASKDSENQGIRFRVKGTEAWSEASDVYSYAGGFNCVVENLEQDTEYEVKAFSAEDESAVTTLRTGHVQDIENKGFEEWMTKNDIIYPYADENHPYWATGNVGSAIVGVTLTEGIGDPAPGSKGQLCARLSSKFANVFGVGKFAAGNLYLGKYVRNDGTNGVVNFGRPFSAHPKALRIWMKYKCGVIDYVGAKQPVSSGIKKGDMDVGTVYVALGNWDYHIYGGTEESPVQIATKIIEDTAFNPQGESVIAYGNLSLREDVPEWRQFDIPIVYYDEFTDKVPTHIVITCSSSSYGDYFTGSTGSVMWLDDFELIY